MKFQEKPACEPSIQLSPDVISGWRQTVWQFARLKGAKEVVRRHGPVEGVIKREAAQIAALWELFTTDREQIHRYLLDPKKQAMAYLLGFHLPNMVRMQMMMERLQTRYDWHALMKSRPNQSITRFMDIGCGSGALSLAFLHYLTNLKSMTHKNYEVNLYDQHGAFLDMARFAIENQFPTVAVKGQKGKIEDKLQFLGEMITRNPQDMFALGLGYVWNELQQRTKDKFLSLLHSLPPLNIDGMIFVIEPANEHLARETMAFRNTLAEIGFQAVYPCLHSGPCPMLELPKDWCFSEGQWNRPKELALVDEILDTNRNKINGVLQVFVTPSLSAKLRQTFDVTAATVVGRPTKKLPPMANGRRPFTKLFDYLTCNTEAALSKEKPAANSLPLHRGMILSTTSVPEPESKVPRKTPGKTVRKSK